MTAFTRLTVLGRTHRCELVVPSDEILGAVLPRVLDLLHEGAVPVARPLRLVLPTGDQLDVTRTPADQQLRDGAVVRLVRAEDAPPPPEVADVTDVLGDDFGARTDLWSDRARTATGAVALGALGAAGAGLVPATATQRLLVVGAVLLLAVLAARLPGVGRPAAPDPAGRRPGTGSPRHAAGARPPGRHPDPGPLLRRRPDLAPPGHPGGPADRHTGPGPAGHPGPGPAGHPDGGPAVRHEAGPAGRLPGPGPAGHPGPGPAGRHPGPGPAGHPGPGPAGHPDGRPAGRLPGPGPVGHPGPGPVGHPGPGPVGPLDGGPAVRPDAAPADHPDLGPAGRPDPAPAGHPAGAGAEAVGRAGAVLLTGLALGIAAVTALRLALAPGVTATGWVLPVATAVGILGWTCVGVGVGIGLGRRSVLAGCAVGLAAVCVPLAAAGAGPERAAAIGAVVAVVGCGLLPRYAAAAAGLTALDAAVLGGRPAPRGAVRTGVDRTYATLTWSVFGVAWTLAATSGVLLGSADGWAAGLGLAVVTVTALRTRGFPVAAQQAALWAAVLAALVVGGFGRAALAPGAVAAGLAVLAAGVLLLTLARPAAHTRAALRQLGDLVEVVAVAALVPLLLGMSGVYADLLGAF